MAGRLPGFSSGLFLSPDNPENLTSRQHPFDPFGFPALELFEPDILLNATHTGLKIVSNTAPPWTPLHALLSFSPSGSPVALLYLAWIMPHLFESLRSTHFLLTLQRRWKADYSLCHRNKPC
ncbi:MAG: hypothetical protein VST70_04370 [Nitrospirota bacterium]|nr:hypothetical protein [Nitrospirota bacterium]